MAEACDEAARRLADGEAGEAVCGPAIEAANRGLIHLGGAQARDLATTLVVAVVTAWSDGEGIDVGVARVGDSTAMTIGAAGWDELFASKPGADDLTSTATPALPADSPAIELAARRLPSGVAVVLMTDGIANPLRDGPSTVAPALAASLQSAPTPLTLVALADFARQGCHDDRTLVGLWRRSAVGNDELPGGPAPGLPLKPASF